MKRETKRSMLLCLLLSTALLFTACTFGTGGEDTAKSTEPVDGTNADKTTTAAQNGDGGNTNPSDPVYGSSVGDLCQPFDIPMIGDDPTGYTETFNISQNNEKMTVINFWFTTCQPCINEMPYFNKIATDYADTVQVIAIHADFGIRGKLESLDYIDKHYGDFNVQFGYDTNDAFYTSLGGDGAYPYTVILDKNNVIVAVFHGSVTYETLEGIISQQLAK